MWKAKIRKTFSPALLIINTITWFSLTWFIIGDFTEETSLFEIFLVSGSYYGAFIIFALIGATLLHSNLKNKRSLLLWTTISTAICMLSAAVIADGTSLTLVTVAFIFGAVVGVGMPTSLALFADYIEIENRGRISALLFFAIQLLTALIYSVISNLKISDKFLILGAWRLLGLVGAYFYKPIGKPSKELIRGSFFVIFKEKSFILYFFPWFLFCFVNFIEDPILEQFFGVELFSMHVMVGFLTTGFSAFLGGILCDLKGRKTASIVGFVQLGVTYAILSFFPGAWLVQFLFMLFGGVAWGILYVTFIFVVWGDLSDERIREKYYFIGGMPFLLSGLIKVLAQPFVKFIPIYMSFSFASFFLFAAVIPLMFAPETLPEKAVKERELRSYIEKAKKVREKFT